MFFKTAAEKFNLKHASFRIMVADNYFVADLDFFMELNNGQYRLIFTTDGIDKLFYYYITGTINEVNSTGSTCNCKTRPR